MSRIVVHRLPVVDALDEHARRHGLSSRALARQLDVTPTTVTNWLRGITRPTLDVDLQHALAQLLGVSPVDVLRLFGLDVDGHDTP